MSSVRKPQKDSSFSLFLAAAVFLVGLYFIFGALSSRKIQDSPQLRDAELTHEQKVEFYRKQLGEKLNRARTLAEHDFYVDQAQKHPSDYPTVEARETLADLPMNYEHRDFAPREPSKFPNRLTADQQIAYDLKEEQNADFWEEEARRMFLRQYILNARAKGYDVAIDRNYNVIVRKAPQRIAGERAPQSIEVLTPLVIPQFSPPFYTRPYCARN